MSMIGAAVWRLRADTGGTLPELHGRTLYSAFLAALGAISPALAAELHDTSRPNPFSLSPLLRTDETSNGGRRLRRGDVLDLRVAALSDALCDFVRYRAPESLKVGRITFAVERVMTERTEHPAAGFTDAETLRGECFAAPVMEEATFRFLSPTMFHVGKNDFPWPLPELVFASLADRWVQAGLPGDLDKRAVHAEAQAILPLAWQGGTMRVTIRPRQEKLAFTGTFAYDLRPLPEETRRRFLLLTRFAEYCGVGRLTSQAFGQVRTMWR